MFNRTVGELGARQQSAMNWHVHVSGTGFMVAACRFFVSSRRRHTRFDCDWSSDVCSSDLRSYFYSDEEDKKAKREWTEGYDEHFYKKAKRDGIEEYDEGIYKKAKRDGIEGYDEGDRKSVV